MLTAMGDYALRDDGPKFNDDLLANPGDLQKFEDHFPTVVHVFDDKKLQAYFKKYEVLASAAKSKSRKWGARAIVLGTAAILLAGLEIILESYSGHGDDGVLRAQLGDTAVYVVNALLLLVALIAAGFGISSVVISGFGVLFGRKKREWLYHRFAAETIRQFHFQTILARLPDILESMQHADAKAQKRAKAAFESKRMKWLSELQSRFEGHVGSWFEGVIGLREEGWWHRQRPQFDLGADRPELEPLFSSYRQLRIEHQLNYANHKLEFDYKIFSSMPRRQAFVLETVRTWGLAVLFTIHIAVLIIVIGVALSRLAFGGHEFFLNTFASVSGFLNAVIIAIPVVILATRTVANGLLPEWEIDRYEKYRAGVEAILRQYDTSDTQLKKLALMHEMERLAFGEMRDFMRSNDRSIFLI